VVASSVAADRGLTGVGPAGPIVREAGHPDDWWRHGVVYQVYPRSFQDSNGDGIGDLAGIRSRLGYLQDLGVDALWISPIYPSPMADFGYDVSDYCDIHPIFGTLEEFDALLGEVHTRGMKLILDFVPNHSSDQHPWFVASRRDRVNAFRDFYLWRDSGPDGGPPNNWRSNFGGPAWSFDEGSGQWYYHAFLPQQPDLNWRNPQVRQRMYDALRFWLARGVDGFRVDVIWHLIKDAAWRDNPPHPDWRPGMAPSKALLQVHSADQPELMDLIAEMRAVVAEFDSPQSSRILIGEIYLPLERLVAYYGPDQAGTLRGVQLPFNFHLISTHWEAPRLADLVSRYEALLPAGGWPNWVLGNHDQPRIASRIGEPRAALAAMLLLTLRGTPTLYYGDELGMHDAAIPEDEVQDPAGLREPGLGLGRDPQRTPMQWNSGPGGGFSASRPWLPLGADHEQRNVERQATDPRSLLSMYRELLTLRRREPALHAGVLESVAAAGDCLAFERVAGTSRLRVELNFAEAPAEPPQGCGPAAVVFSTAGYGSWSAGVPGDRADARAAGFAAESPPRQLLPFEGRILRIDGSAASPAR
jgi:alpha-glucosidase